MKSVSVVLGVIIGPVLIAAGSVIWQDRLAFDVTSELENALQEINQSPMQLETGQEIFDCASVRMSQNGLLIVIHANLFADTTARGYLETAPNSRGIFIDYDPTDGMNGPIFRLGIGGGTTDIFVPIRTVRNDERSLVVIGLTKSSVRVVTNTVDTQITFPASFKPLLECNSVKVGEVDALRCAECATDVFVVAPLSPSQIGYMLDRVSNKDRFNAYRIGGSVLVLAGFGALWRTSRSLLAGRKTAHQVDGS